MSLQGLNILINDTKVGQTVLNVERTEAKNPTLKYDGGDDEYQPLIASQLSFNMLVEDAFDAHFLHLFTGEETRYEVQLENASTNNLLWQGHLLPDQYNEPYKNGSLFVEFTATDGLGILKNKYLTPDFYEETKTIPQILGACLQLTANNFNMIIAPAIGNAVQNMYVYEMELNTSLFEKDGEKKSAYEILEAIITSLGCNLFQWDGYWYIVGVNRKNEVTVDCEFYTLAGNRYVADGITTFARNIHSVIFEANPSVTAIPPFKRVNVNFDAEFEKNIFPKELFKENLQSNGVSFSFLNNWKENGGQIIKFASESGNPYAQIKDGTNYYIGIYNVFSYSNVESHYIDLTQPRYLSVQETKNGYSVNVTIEGVFWVTEDPQIALDYGDYEQKVLFELLLDGVVMLSNKSDFNASNKFNFELKKAGTYKTDLVTFYGVQFSLEAEGIDVRKSGYWNVKLHCIQDNAVVSVIYKKFDVIVNDEVTFDYSLSRNIDFSLSKDVDVEYAFVFNDSVKNQFSISPFTHLNEPYQYTIPAEERLINTQNFTEHSITFGSSSIDWVNLDVSEVDYKFLLLNPNKLYQKNTSGVFTKIPKYYISEGEASITGYYVSVFKKDMELTATDEFYYKTSASTVTITDDNYMRSAWQRIGTSEKVSWLEALAKLYHSTVRQPKFKIEGTLFGLFTPLDILQFRYITAKNYNPTTLTLRLDEGMTDVVMVESTINEIEDYE